MDRLLLALFLLFLFCSFAGYIVSQLLDWSQDSTTSDRAVGPPEVTPGKHKAIKVEPGVMLLGSTVDRYTLSHHPLTADHKLLRVHAISSGHTQYGKTRLNIALLLQKMALREQVIVFDPQGTMCAFMRDYMVASGAFRQDPTLKDRVLFYELHAAMTKGLYPGLSILDQDLSLHDTAVSVLDAVHRVWPELKASSALDPVVLYGCAVLIHHRLPVTLLTTFLLDKDFRDQLLIGFPDETIVSYWQDEFDNLPKQLQAEEITATRRRNSRLMFSPELRYSLSNALAPNLANWRQALSEKKSIIIDLRFPSDLSTKLWGALLMSTLEQSIMSRSGRPNDPESWTTCFADEFPMYFQKEHSDEGLNTFLQRTLGKGFSMWLCHQDLSTVPQSTRDGALNNCALRIAFRLGPQDAEANIPHFFNIDPLRVKYVGSGPDLPRPTYSSVEEQNVENQLDLMNLQFREAMIRLPDGRKGKFFTPTLPDVDVTSNPELSAEIDELKDYYLQTLFRSGTEIVKNVNTRLEAAGVSPDQLAQLKAEKGNATPRRTAGRSTKGTRIDPTPSPKPDSATQNIGATIEPDAPLSSAPTEPSVAPLIDEDDETRFKVPAPRRK